MGRLWWDGGLQRLTYVEGGDDARASLDRDHVLVDVAFSGVCGSDFAYMRGNMGKHNAKQDGVVLGHEFSAIVTQVGTSVTHFKAGDRVVVDPNSSCEACQWCEAVSPQFCESNDAVGVKRDGGWSVRCCVPSKQVYAIPDRLPLDVAALCEPFSCVLRGWNRVTETSGGIGKLSGGRALVQGAGIIGVLFTLLLRHHDFADVTVAEIKEERRSAVRGFLPRDGYRVMSPADIEAELLSAEDGVWTADEDGYDLVIDCTGNLRVFQQDIKLARRGATILAFGCCPAQGRIEIEPFQIYWKELRLLGSFLNPNSFPEAIRLLDELNAKGWIDLERMGVEKFQLRDFRPALDRLRKGLASKVFFSLGQP